MPGTVRLRLCRLEDRRKRVSSLPIIGPQRITVSLDSSAFNMAPIQERGKP